MGWLTSKENKLEQSLVGAAYFVGVAGAFFIAALMSIIMKGDAAAVVMAGGGLMGVCFAMIEKGKLDQHRKAKA